jgi:hypothetical protein
MAGDGVAYHWQVTVLPVFVAAGFPMVLPVATICEVEKH